VSGLLISVITITLEEATNLSTTIQKARERPRLQMRGFVVWLHGVPTRSSSQAARLNTTPTMTEMGRASKRTKTIFALLLARTLMQSLSAYVYEER
jgi:hypothetical protein